MDTQAVETFRTNLCAQLHAQQVPLDTTVHVWVIDEMRFRLQPVWTRTGINPAAPVEPHYSHGYTFGALEVSGNGAEFLHTDGVSQEASLCFYNENCRERSFCDPHRYPERPRLSPAAHASRSARAGARDYFACLQS